MTTGRVKIYKPEKGYGFLLRDDRESDVFFHISQWLGENGDPVADDRVRFDVGDTLKKPGKRMAFRVTPI